MKRSIGTKKSFALYIGGFRLHSSLMPRKTCRNASFTMYLEGLKPLRCFEYNKTQNAGFIFCYMYGIKNFLKRASQPYSLMQMDF